MVLSPDMKRQLDSDDEYPDLTEELEKLEQSSSIPAYLMDDRFQQLDLTCPKNNEVSTKPHSASKQSKKDPKSILQQFQKDLYMKTCKLRSESVVVEAGVLSRQDLTCLRAVEPTTSDAGVLWFLNYLKSKDLQKMCDKHLVSCLAVDSSVGVYRKQDEAPFRKLHNFTVSVL